MAAISAMAPRFISSGYGSSPGPTENTGPSGMPSMIPHTSSPKCTSFTVATVANRSPRRGSVRNEKPSISWSVSGSSPS